jgi:tetratricopeptide (TPR) repeat protein
MRRPVLAFIAALCLCSPVLADDNEDVEKCQFWRLGKDEADSANRFAACDRVIAGKNFSKEQRAAAFAKRADGSRENHHSKTDAIADFDQALALDPSKFEWRRDLAFMLYFDKQYDRAIKEFNAVLEAKPEDAQATFFRGLAWLDKKDEARGFADLARGMELDASDYWYPYQRAVELAERGRAQEALPDLDRAIAIKGSEVNPYLLRADILDKRGETDKALADLSRVLELEPQRSTAYINRANIYEKMGQLDRAIADYDKLITLNPGDEYYLGRKKALAEKLAARGGEPPAAAPVVPPPQTPAPTPPEAKAPEPKTKAAENPPGTTECRRFDAIANRTISIPCPD